MKVCEAAFVLKRFWHFRAPLVLPHSIFGSRLSSTCAAWMSEPMSTNGHVQRSLVAQNIDGTLSFDVPVVLGGGGGDGGGFVCYV